MLQTGGKYSLKISQKLTKYTKVDEIDDYFDIVDRRKMTFWQKWQ